MQAARKHTAVAVVSVFLLAALSLAGTAGGFELPHKSDRRGPSAPSHVRVEAATPTTVSLAWSHASDASGVAFYDVYVDSRRARVAGSTYTATDLECGQSVGVRVVAFDPSLNRSTAATATVSTAACADGRAPTPPSAFRQAAATEDSVILQWSASSDDIGVVAYRIYRNQLLVQSSAEPTATLTGLTCGSTLEFQVDAVDAAGNRSEQRSAWVQAAPCAPAPAHARAAQQSSTAVALAEPTGLSVGDVTGESLLLTWSPSVNAVAYDVFKNGAKVATVTSTSVVQGGLQCDSLYWFGVEARDAAGTSSSRTRVSATTAKCPSSSDKTPPTTPSSLGIQGVTDTSVALTWSASTDDVAVVGYDVFRNGAKMVSVFSTSFRHGGLGCGTSYWFGVEARDAAGNRSARVRTNAVTSECSAPAPPPPPPPGPAPADVTPPTPPTNLAVGSVSRTSVSLTWSASSDAVGLSEYRVYVDGATAANTTVPAATVSGLACGRAFTFEVDAADTAGNRSSRARVTASTSACSDTQAPTVPTNVVVRARTDTSIALAWSPSTDNVGVTQYGLYRGGSPAGSSTTTTGIFSGLVCNTNYTLAVDAADAAGNRSGKATVMVSTTACPDTAAPSSPAGLAGSSVTQSSLTLTWNASTDNVGVVGYDVYRNGTKMESVTSRSSNQIGLTCGTAYWFGVEALDAAGNRSVRAHANATTTACAPAPPPPPPPSGTIRDVFPGQSIAAVINASSGGDTVRVNAGSYPQLTLSKSFSTPLRVVGQPGAVIAGVLLPNVSGYLFEGIRSEVPVDSSTLNASAFYINGTSSNITLRNSFLKGGYVTLKQYAAYPGWSRGITIEDNEITGGGGDLIHVDGADDILIEHNYLHDPVMVGGQHHDAFQIQRGNNWRVVRNYMEWDSVPKGWGPNQGMMISREYSTDTLANGLIANNLVAHWHGGRPLIISDIEGPLRVVNNTLVDSGDGIGITVSGGNGPVSGVEIWNNIVQSVFQESGASASVLDSNWYTEPQEGNVQGARARSGNPGFTDTTSYALTASSPARGIGLTRAGTPLENIDGVLRVIPPDLGAR